MREPCARVLHREKAISALGKPLNAMEFIRGHDICYFPAELFVVSVPHPRTGIGTFSLAFVRAYSSPCGANHESIESKLVEGIQNECDLVMAPEYSFTPRDAVFTEREKDNILYRITKQSRGKHTLAIPGTVLWKNNHGTFYNSFYAISNGEIIATYHKINDGGEVNIANRTGLQWQPGKNPAVFRWQNLQVGAEICKDRCELTKRGYHDLDIHLFVSCGLNQTVSATHQFGYTVINDGKTACIEIQSGTKQLFHQR